MQGAVAPGEDGSRRPDFGHILDGIRPYAPQPLGDPIHRQQVSRRGERDSPRGDEALVIGMAAMSPPLDMR